MKGGLFILIAGIFLAYLGVSGKYACITKAVKCLAGVDDCNCSNTASVSGKTGADTIGSAIPKLPSLPKIGDINVISSLGG